MSTPPRPDKTCVYPTCGVPVEGVNLCQPCTDRFEQTLAETPWLTEQLQITITREKAKATEPGGRSAEKPLPYHAKASQAATDLRYELAKLVHLLRVTGEVTYPIPGCDNPNGPTTVQLANVLLRELKAIRRGDYGPSVDGINRASTSALWIIDRPEGKVYAGPCECGRDLYARKGAARVGCRGCDREYDVTEMVEWMKSQVADRLVTAREGAGLLSRFDLPTEQKTIDTWHQRKRLVSRGTSPNGRRLYLFADLLTLAATTKRPA